SNPAISGLSVNQSSFSKVIRRVPIPKAEPPNKNEIITGIAKIVRRGSGSEKPQAATGLQFSKKIITSAARRDETRLNVKLSHLP
ncbi:hypothetical protein, partial [Sutterella wadsworthensis]|uniref:hypothetical protein n=1 Tax=Sutterella wadsworthensis TaxID=40545 RepID=UPI003967CEFD